MPALASSFLQARATSSGVSKWHMWPVRYGDVAHGSATPHAPPGGQYACLRPRSRWCPPGRYWAVPVPCHFAFPFFDLPPFDFGSFGTTLSK